MVLDGGTLLNGVWTLLAFHVVLSSPYHLDISMALVENETM